MKKIFNSMLAMAIAVFTFSACEDVPEPYSNPNGGGNGGGGEEGTYINETFSTGFGSFEVKTITGTPWVIDYSTAKATGYDNTTKVTTPSESYLVSSAVDLSTSTGAYLQFDYIYMYKREGAVNKVLITDDYTGDPSTTNWEDITGELTVGSGWDVFSEYKSNIGSKYIGKSGVRIALYYACASQSSTIEVKNLVLKEGKIESGGEGGGGETPDVITPVNGTYINETFSSSFGVFSVGNVTGTPWAIDFSTAKATGYDNTTKVTTPSKSYLVSKPMDMTTSTTAATVSFEYILRYVTTTGGGAVDGIANKVLITDNYTGDPTTTEWTDITGQLTEGTDWQTFSKYSASVPAAFLGQSKVTIALYYECAASSGTWEVKNLTVKDGTGEGGEGGGEIGGNSITVDVNSFGFANQAALGELTLSDGTTLTFSKGDGSTQPAYYTTGGGTFRIYPSNTISVSSAKTITNVAITCDEYNGQIYNASGDITSTAGTVNVSGTSATISGVSEKSFVIKNSSTTTGGPSQLRIKSLVITYAE